MLDTNGVASLEQVKSRFPAIERLIKPKAVIECYEDIPCNPCSTSCPFDAITIGENINNQPVLNVDKCTGCGVCVHSCPGLAIMVVQVDGESAKFKIPYEFSNLPTVGEKWLAINRSGEVIGEARILKVISRPKQDKTTIIEVAVDKDLLYSFSSIKKGNTIDNTTVCRCEDITKDDIKKILESGTTDFEEIKRMLRIGMGPCQGNTCSQLVQREISKFLNIKIDDVPLLNSRPLVVGVKLKSINEGREK